MHKVNKKNIIDKII